MKSMDPEGTGEVTFEMYVETALLQQRFHTKTDVSFVLKLMILYQTNDEFTIKYMKMMVLY